MPQTSTSKTTNSKDGKYAIVEASGQQFWVQQNRYYDFDRIDAKVDEKISITEVLLLKDGEKTTVGAPYVSGATVEIQIMEHRRGPKIIVYKMRPKKKTRKKNGHRQELTRVMVTGINTTKSSPKSKKSATSTVKESKAKTSVEKEASSK
tara:strand:+ start:676 stop:1125 length:450 start_codon:yes stop_codon:yes gene_type:complete